MEEKWKGQPGRFTPRRGDLSTALNQDIPEPRAGKGRLAAKTGEPPYRGHSCGNQIHCVRTGEVFE
jgi:hypothetical protein